MKMTIRRRHWLRGNKDSQGNEADSVMRNENGHMCCLGFYALAKRFTVKEILYKSMPSTVARANPTKAYKLGSLVRQGFNKADYDDSVDCEIFAETNDLVGEDIFAEKQREKGLTRLFKEIGCAVTFVP